MHGDVIRGSDEEIKHQSDDTKIPLELMEDNINILNILYLLVKQTRVIKY